MILLFLIYFMVKTDAEWYWYVALAAVLAVRAYGVLKQYQDKQRREAEFELMMMGEYKK